MANFVNGALRSKTIMLAIALALFGYIETNMQLVAPFLSQKDFGLFTMIIGAIVAVLRVLTTDSLYHKGDDNKQSRETDKDSNNVADKTT